ncbi:MAG: aminotransferase class I/II-fold pyridoxal phosphate-dependent enzyme [Flavisolibacter sp.]
MKKNQSKVPIIEAIQKYHQSGITPFTTPGHKKGAGIFDEDKEAVGSGVYYNDISMQNGADDRRESKGIQEEAEKLAAEAVGADESFYSTNGSSLSAHVAVLSVANIEDKILVTRNVHKSLPAALIMADVIPVFLNPEINDDLDIENGVTPEHLEEMLNKHPDAKGVFIVSPTYYGVTSDVEALAKICHKRKIPLVVDEAWGPHLPFNKELPASALSCGADMSFGSLHKTMNGLGQSSIINLKGKLIDQDRFTLCFDLFESTSPSAVLMASCDAARRQMALHGEELWGKALELSRRARTELGKLKGLRVIGKEVTGTPGAFALDETKLTIDVKKLGINGYHAADWMLKNYKITFELITHRHLMAFISVADTDETVDQLIQAIKALHKWAKAEKPDSYVDMPHHRELGTELIMTPTKAFFRPTRQVSLDEAEGEIIAEMVSPYPPGIPRLIPGERVTASIIDYLKKGRDAGMFVLDPTDQKLKKLRVVDLSSK